MSSNTALEQVGQQFSPLMAPVVNTLTFALELNRAEYLQTRQGLAVLAVLAVLAILVGWLRQSFL